MWWPNWNLGLRIITERFRVWYWCYEWMKQKKGWYWSDLNSTWNHCAKSVKMCIDSSSSSSLGLAVILQSHRASVTGHRHTLIPSFSDTCLHQVSHLRRRGRGRGSKSSIGMKRFHCYVCSMFAAFCDFHREKKAGPACLTPNESWKWQAGLGCLPYWVWTERCSGDGDG